MRKRVLGGLFIAGLLANTALGSYTSYTWTGAVGDGQWSNPANWSPSGVPDATSQVYLDGSKASATKLNLNSGAWSANFISLANSSSSAPFFIENGTLSLAAVESSSTNATLYVDASITTNNPKLTLSTYTQPLVVSGVIGGNGVGRNDFFVNVSGTPSAVFQSVIFANANTYSGETDVSGADLTLTGTAGAITPSSLIQLDKARLTLDNSLANDSDRVGLGSHPPQRIQ